MSNLLKIIFLLELFSLFVCLLVCRCVFTAYVIFGNGRCECLILGSCLCCLLVSCTILAVFVIISLGEYGRLGLRNGECKELCCYELRKVLVKVLLDSVVVAVDLIIEFLVNVLKVRGCDVLKHKALVVVGLADVLTVLKLKVRGECVAVKLSEDGNVAVDVLINNLLCFLLKLFIYACILCSLAKDEVSLCKSLTALCKVVCVCLGAVGDELLLVPSLFSAEPAESLMVVGFVTVDPVLIVVVSKVRSHCTVDAHIIGGSSCLNSNEHAVRGEESESEACEKYYRYYHRNERSLAHFLVCGFYLCHFICSFHY